MLFMSKKVSVRLPDHLAEQLRAESILYGYRGLSAYIITLLEKRKIIEIAGGADLAAAISRLMQMPICACEFEEGRDEICRCFALLMTEIETLQNYLESSDMPAETGTCQQSNAEE